MIAGSVALMSCAAPDESVSMSMSAPNDNLNATLWMQSSVEYAGVTGGIPSGCHLCVPVW